MPEPRLRRELDRLITLDSRRRRLRERPGEARFQRST